MNIQREYKRLRQLNWTAQLAWSAAKTNVAWDEAEARGPVRVVCEPDEYMTLEDLCGDNASKRELRLVQARAERDGVWNYRTEYLDPIEGWTLADQCAGFVGDDWHDSLYDVDMKQSALKRIPKH